MTRRHIAFACEDSQLVGTLDDAPGKHGLLIVTGGNETRAGAFSGQAALAARVAAAGYPVFRFDRRGVGDSEGENAGFRGSGRDIAAAFATFVVEQRGLERVVAFGNCDAASALMLFGGAGCHSLVLANPWTFDEEASEEMSPGAVRARYAEKLKDPREVLRLVRGNVSPVKLLRGMRQAMRPAPPPSSLLDDMREGMTSFTGPVRYLVSGRDRTGLAFAESWKTDPIDTLSGGDHAFSAPESSDWLFSRLIDALEE